MLNRWNTSIPALCVSSLLLIGCGDTQTASTNASAPEADRSAQADHEADGSQTEQVASNVTEAAPASTRTPAPAAISSQRDADLNQPPIDVAVDGFSSKTNPETQTGARLVVAEPEVLNLGEMATGETKRGVVTLRNTGDQPMRVLDSRTSCGCTVANVPKGQELKPGDTVDVEVSLRGGTRPEHLNKTVTFIIEGQAPTTVRVEGRTVAYVVVEPAIIQFDNLRDNQIVLRAEDGEPFRITSMNPPIAENMTSEAKTEHVLTLSPDRWEESGQPRRMLFTLDHPKVAQLPANIRVPAGQTHAHSGLDDSVVQSRSTPAARLTLDAMIVHGHTEAFLERMADEDFNVEYTDRTGTTLLSVAAKRGNVEIIQALIDAGADLEATDVQGRTPLMHAAQSKNALAVRALLSAGANVDARDTALANTALSWASGFGDADSVRELLDAGAAVEIVSNATGFTPLIMAAGFGEADSVRHLIDAGANVEAMDTLQGFTAVMYAASTGKVDNIKALIEGNANIEAKDPNGRTVLLVAAGAAGANAETIQALIDAGADVSAVDRSGKNAMDFAQARTDPRRDEVVAVLEPVMVAASE